MSKDKTYDGSCFCGAARGPRFCFCAGSCRGRPPVQPRGVFAISSHPPRPPRMIFNLTAPFPGFSFLGGRDVLVSPPPVPMAAYRDSFGNWCTRVVAPKGRMRVSADAMVNDGGAADAVVPQARQLPVPELPEETLLFLLGSRYCETDRLSEAAWQLFV